MQRGSKEVVLAQDKNHPEMQLRRQEGAVQHFTSKQLCLLMCFCFLFFFKEPALSCTWSVLGAHTDDIFSYLGLPKLKWYKLRNPGVAACV